MLKVGFGAINIYGCLAIWIDYWFQSGIKKG